MPDRLRIFISSPGDVSEERLRAHLVVQKLARDYARYFKVEAYLWEHEPMLASGHFQDAIEPPSASDVVVLILYSRLGTQLPERTEVREYRGIDGRAPVTGTEWEYEEALAASRARGAPDLLAYRKLGDPGASLVDAARRAEQERQWTALEGFWRRHFEDSGMFLAGSAKFQTLEEFDRRLEADLTALIERKIAAGKEAGRLSDEGSWYRGNPYQGLASYDFEHSAIFFGRDGQTRAAVTRLQGAAERGTAFLFVAGGSGSGKSSLARAGVLPAIVAPKAVPGVAEWRRVVARPGDGADDPVLGLARALIGGDPKEGTGLAELTGSGIDAEALAVHLSASADDPSFPFRTALNRIAEESRAAGQMLAHESARLILLVDQLEELFGPRITQERRDLYARILAGLARSGVVWVVATMRSDLWHRAAETRALVDLIEAGARLDLQPPDGAEILEMVRRPAAVAGLDFETDREWGVALDAVIANAAADDSGALPLLSVMLHALYLRDIVGADPGKGVAHALTFKSYRELGELRGAIARRAEETLGALAERDPEAAGAFPVVLRSLVTVSADRNTVTARTARLDQFSEGGPEARLIAAFLASDARLLVASASDRGAEVRVAHEALLSHWPRAQEQIATDRRDLETRSRLEPLQHRWAEASNARDKKATLLTGLNLAEGRDLVRRWRLEPTPLGAYVAQSQRAATFRRRWMSAAAAALVVVFGSLAALAGLQWQRAEAQAQAARQAEEVERQARAEAEEQRAEAERQRADAELQRAEAERQRTAAIAEQQRADAERQRAIESENRAVAALQETKRQTARTLASQAELTLTHNDVRQALRLAVGAAEAEAGALTPETPPASIPALLKAMAQARQELHMQRPSASRAMPYDFLGDDTLVYADPGAGLVIVDLEPAAEIRLRAALPAGMVPTHLKAFNGRGWVAVAGSTALAIIEAETGRTHLQLELPSAATALDVHEASGFAAVGFGSGFMLIPPEVLTPPVAISVPAPRDGVNVGQVRFSRSGGAVYVTYGPDILLYDVAAGSFLDQPIGPLSAGSVGGDQAVLAEILRTGAVVVTEIVPDLINPDRLFMAGALELVDRKLGDPTTRAFERSDANLQFLGLSFTDQANTGSLQESVAILSGARHPQQDFQLSYVDEEAGTLTPFESFTVVADDMAGEKPYSCKVSLNVSHLVCHYWGASLEGLVSWRLLGGNHRFERIVARPATGSIAVAPDAEATLFATRDNEIIVSADGRETVAGSLGAGWRLGQMQGLYIAAHSAAEGRAKIFRFDAGSRRLDAVAEAASVAPPTIDPVAGRALFAAAERVTLVDLATGGTVWSAAAPPGIQSTFLSAASGQVGILTSSTLQLLGITKGEMVAEHAVTPDPGTPAAFDPAGRRLAFVSNGSLTLFDLASGSGPVVAESRKDVAALAWSTDGATLIAGWRDGGVAAWNAAGQPLWKVRTPLGESFSEKNAWPDQPPKGLVLAIEVSPEGGRLAVIRQDMPGLDLYETRTGRLLTTLTPPWSFGVPASVSLPDESRVATSWAVHAMTRNEPSAVTTHLLPGRFGEALAAARARLQALERIWAPAEAVPVRAADSG